MFSIRWKLTLGLLALTVLFVGIYIALAKQIFESDKISYVFETQQNQVDSTAENLRRDLEKSMADIKTVAYVASFGSVDSARSAFDNEERMIALEALKQGRSIYRFEKSKGLLDRATLPSGDLKNAKMEIHHIENNLFAFTTSLPDRNQDWLAIRGVFRVPSLLGEHFEHQTVFITENQKLVAQAGTKEIGESDLQKVIQSWMAQGATLTRSEMIGNSEYLISRSRLIFDQFSTWGMTPKSEALGALQILYRRSLFFFGFSFFAALTLALFMSYGLTKNINRLTGFAKRVGKGDFSERPVTSGSDEVGVLSRAFASMMDEIQKLLQATADKARMENELKTARVVQESLFPKKQETQAGSLKISGFYTTSSECGGDWWYYFQRGDELQAVIADATGHGTPAALITSAARSMYTYIEREEVSLHDSADLLDSAIHECSSGKLGMTAMLLRIHKDTGFCSYVSASHEDAVILTPLPSGRGFKADFLQGNKSSTLGENRKNWSQNSFHLEPGQKLVMWTDGLTAMAEQAGKSLGEKRFLKNFEKVAAAARTPSDLCQNLFDHFHELGENKPLVDDVTLVVIENTKSRQ